MRRLRSTSILVALLLAMVAVQVASAEVTQMFGSRKSVLEYSGVEAISSTNDPNEVEHGVSGILTWAAGPVAMRMNVVTSSGDDPFIETGPRKVRRTSSTIYDRYPYLSYDRGANHTPQFMNLVSQPLSPASYNKYTVWNSGGTFSVRFCKWEPWTNNYTGCTTWNPAGGINMNRLVFDNVVAGGESLCGFVSGGGCPVGFVRHTENRFLNVSNNIWYAYCYTTVGGSPYVYNAPDGYLTNGTYFAAGRVSACGPGPNFDVLYR